jgi:pyruvate formate lyase activating enzyme
MPASKADVIEPLDVREPPGRAMGKVAELWKPLDTGKIMCTACARYCKIGEGQVGLCGVRGVHDGKLWLYVYGKVITGHVDPIEKKPVMHYRPGSKIFSIATTGCSWLCRYCQNFDISQRRKVEGIEVEPQDVVNMTLEQGCQGLAYTYNEPSIFIEFARDIGIAARKAGLINIFVSNGYDTPEGVAEMPKFLDCITVDFKGSGETEFVRKYIGIPNADPIFDTLKRIRDTKAVHTEITDLIVPQVGDSLDAARRLSRFVHDELGPDTPIHFLRFHPDYKMNEFPWTPVETLEAHCAVAKEEGLRFVYIGNVGGHPLEHTYCPGCGAIAVRRNGFDITGWYLDRQNRCKKCGYRLPIVGTLEKTFKDDRFYSVLHHR